MRFMVIVKADSNSEAGVMPSTELLTAMGKFNEEMVKAGVMLAGEGLHPSSKGARVGYTGKERRVSRGPFGLTGLVSGFWLIETKSLDEAIDWMKRAPFDGGAEIEIRQVFSPEVFGEALTPDPREQAAWRRGRPELNPTTHQGHPAMRFMMLMIPLGYEAAPAGTMPPAEAVAAMMKYNGALKQAGVLITLDGLHPPSMGARVSFAGGKPVVTDGPFTESKEVMGGYGMIGVNWGGGGLA